MLIERFVGGRARSNAYVLAPSGRAALIVDAGMDAARKIGDFVDREGLEPQALILTHGHPDHMWTARRLCERYDIAAYIHTDDIGWFADPATGGQLRGVRTVGRAIARGRRMRPSRLEGVVDGQVVAAGDIAVAVLHTPGHSRGSVCLRVGDVCFAGDTIFKGDVGRAMFPGGSASQLRESLRTLLALDDDVRLFPGHGADTTVGAERKQWTAYVGG